MEQLIYGEKLLADFSSEILEVKDRKSIFSKWQNKNKNKTYQPRILCLVKLFFKNEGKIKISPDNSCRIS
jgi:hypothetical protein